MAGQAQKDKSKSGLRIALRGVVPEIMANLGQT